MTKSAEKAGTLPTTGRLWAGWAVAIVSWVTHLFLSYSLTEWRCQKGNLHGTMPSELFLHGLTFLCMLGALYGACLGLGSLRQLHRKSHQITYNRQRFMAVGGVLLGLFLAATIVVQGLPNVVLDMCAGITV